MLGEDAPDVVDGGQDGVPGGGGLELFHLASEGGHGAFYHKG